MPCHLCEERNERCMHRTWLLEVAFVASRQRESAVSQSHRAESASGLCTVPGTQMVSWWRQCGAMRRPGLLSNK